MNLHATIHPGDHSTDIELEYAIRTYLTNHRQGFHRIDVAADEGVVRLTGSVASHSIRQTALAVVRHVVGVRKVVDALEIVPVAV